MEWFKHYVSASDDPKLALIQEQFGFAGIGRWWRIVETVAAQVQEKQQATIAYSPGRWCRLLGYPNYKLVDNFLQALAERGLIVLGSVTDRSATLRSCSIPNLLKIRDRKTQRREEKRREEQNSHFEGKKPVEKPFGRVPPPPIAQVLKEKGIPS
jgi:hypothetical protein